MALKRLLFGLPLILITLQSFPQVGGEGAYDYLNLTTNPRVAALGGKVASLDDPELGLTLYNPSLLNSSMHNQFALSYVGYYAGIKYGTAIYSRSYEGIGTFGFGITEVNYGTFTEASETGVITGSFTASDMAVNLLYSRTFESVFTVGVNIKPLYSHLASYKSFGIAADIGVNYNNKRGLFSASIVLKNIGTMIKPYTPDTWERPPFEIVAGFSKKLAHAPFRFVATFHQLQNYSLYYNRPTKDNTSLEGDNTNSDSKLKKFSDEAFSHLILGVEFVPFKSFCFRVGYNYQRRNELKVDENVSSVGFSWGFGVKISKFQISYGQSRYHLSGPSKYFAISTDLDDLFGWNKL